MVCHSFPNRPLPEYAQSAKEPSLVEKQAEECGWSKLNLYSQTGSKPKLLLK